MSDISATGWSDPAVTNLEPRPGPDAIWTPPQTPSTPPPHPGTRVPATPPTTDARGSTDLRGSTDAAAEIVMQVGADHVGADDAAGGGVDGGVEDAREAALAMFRRSTRIHFAVPGYLVIVTDRLEDLFCLFAALGAQPTTQPTAQSTSPVTTAVTAPGNTMSDHACAPAPAPSTALALARSATLLHHRGRPGCHVVVLPDWALAQVGQPPTPAGPKPEPEQQPQAEGGL